MKQTGQRKKRALLAMVAIGIAVAHLEGASGRHGGEPAYELAAYEVVTTGTRTERLVTDVAVRTELLGAELFASAGTADLAAALGYLPGAQVEANCQNCGTAEVKLLGLGAGYNQLLFDGQPLFSGLAAVYGLEHIPTAFIERIEVVKGGASSLYGPGAVAGVINIIPREPLVSQTIVEASLESVDGESAEAVVGLWDWVGTERQAAITLYGEGRQNDGVDLNDDGFTEITEKDFISLGSNFWIYPGEETRISGNYAYISELRRGGNRFDLAPHEAQITEQLEHHWHRGGLFLEQDLSDRLQIKTGASVSHIERWSYYGGVGAVPLPGQPGYDPDEYATALEASRLLYGFTETTRVYLDSLFTLQMSRSTLTGGLQYQEDRVLDEKRDDQGRPLRTDGSPAGFPGEDPIVDDSFSNFGAFLQQEWDPSPDLTLVTGIRADRQSELDDWVASPRIALRYTVSPEWILRASVATGFRAPEVFDEDLHIEILDDPTRTRNSAGLKEEESVSWTTGFVWTPGFAEGRLQANLELYRTDINDTFTVPGIVYTDPEGNAYKERVNAGGSTVQGVEANVIYQLTNRLSVDAGLSFNEARFDEAVEVLPGILEKRFIESPEWSGVVKINYSNEELVDVFLGLIYTGPMIALKELSGEVNPSTPDFFVIDLSVTRHIDIGHGDSASHLDLTIGIRNLLDQRQKDLSSGPDRDTTYFYGPRFPRSFFVNLEWRF